MIEALWEDRDPKCVEAFRLYRDDPPATLYVVYTSVTKRTRFRGFCAWPPIPIPNSVPRRLATEQD